MMIHCSFSGEALGNLTKRDRADAALLKAAVLEDGGFSAFDGSETPAIARAFNHLLTDPELVISHDGYPWVRVNLKEPE